MPSSFCPLCGHQGSRLITREGEWDIVECPECRFVFITPLPDEQFLFSHYQKYLPAEEFKIAQWRVMMSEVFQRSLDLIESKAACKNGMLLDIGCGYGFFLEKARQRGWSVFGIEPCLRAREYAKSNSLNIEAEGLFERKFGNGTFDAVTLFYVLEHLSGPLQYLKEIYRILKPGGLLLVRVPHTTPIVKTLKLFAIRNRLYDMPSHLSDFSPRTLALALEKSGFTDIHTFPGGATRPHSPGERIISVSSGLLADFLYAISGKRLLLPGVSKTTIAKRKEA